MHVREREKEREWERDRERGPFFKPRSCMELQMIEIDKIQQQCTEDISLISSCRL